MQVELNGETVETKAVTLSELIEERGFATQSVATAMNGDFVPRGVRSQTPLSNGARIEILSPMQGG